MDHATALDQGKLAYPKTPPTGADGYGRVRPNSSLSEFSFFSSSWGTEEWMAASGQQVFREREIWRLWTTLFAHADPGHLAANAILLLPLTYALSAYFSPLLFPTLGILFGGLVNIAVLWSLPQRATVIGISGVVSWMAGAWLTLFLLIDRRERLKRRVGAAIFLTLLLFVPETLRPEVSYYSHFLGYTSGIAVAFVFYFLQKRKIQSAEKCECPRYEELIEEDEWQEHEAV